jgi:hypothetical protein
MTVQDRMPDVNDLLAELCRSLNALAKVTTLAFLVIERAQGQPDAGPRRDRLSA